MPLVVVVALDDRRRRFFLSRRRQFGLMALVAAPRWVLGRVVLLRPESTDRDEEERPPPRPPAGKR